MQYVTPILDVVLSHMHEGHRKHGDFPDLKTGVDQLRARLDALEAASGSTADADYVRETARRALQLAGLAVKLVQQYHHDDLPLPKTGELAGDSVADVNDGGLLPEGDPPNN